MWPRDAKRLDTSGQAYLKDSFKVLWKLLCVVCGCSQKSRAVCVLGLIPSPEGLLPFTVQHVLKDFIYFFLERGEGREKEGQKH